METGSAERKQEQAFEFVLFILDFGDGRRIGIGDPRLWPRHRVVFSDKSLLDRLSRDEINKRLAGVEDSETIIRDLEQRLLEACFRI